MTEEFETSFDTYINRGALLLFLGFVWLLQALSPIAYFTWRTVVFVLFVSYVFSKFG